MTSSEIPSSEAPSSEMISSSEEEVTQEINYHVLEASKDNVDVTFMEFYESTQLNYLMHHPYNNMKIVIHVDEGFTEEEKERFYIQNDNDISFIATVMSRTPLYVETPIFGRITALDLVVEYPSSIYTFPALRGLYEFKDVLRYMMNNYSILEGTSLKKHQLIIDNPYMKGELNFNDDYLVSDMHYEIEERHYELSFLYFNEEDVVSSGTDVSYELFITNMYTKLNKEYTFNAVSVNATFDLMGYYINRYDESTQSYVMEYIEEPLPNQYISFTEVALSSLVDRPIGNLATIINKERRNYQASEGYSFGSVEEIDLFAVIGMDGSGLFKANEHLFYNYLSFVRFYPDVTLKYDLDELTMNIINANERTYTYKFNDIGMLEDFSMEGKAMSRGIFYNNLHMTFNYSLLEE